MNNIKYLGYVRKSSEGERQQAQSIETQTHILTEYATKSGINLIDIIRESRSAKDDGNRPMFESLLSRIIAGEANGILVAHIDRLARNGVDAGQLDKLLGAGVIQEIITPSRTYTSKDNFSLGLELLIAADYSRRLSGRVKEGNETKLRRGEFPRYAPIGYINKDKNIVLDPERSSLIAELFEKYSTSQFSLSQMVKYMDDRGLRSRSSRKPLVKATIHRILSDHSYYGVISHKDTLYPGNFPPLISKSVFNKVQDVLSGKRVCGKTARSFLYRDFLICAECGCKMTADIKKGKYIYYYCTNGKGKCSQHKKYLQQDITKGLIAELFNDFSLPEELATTSLSMYLEETRQQTSNQMSMTEFLTKELNQQKAKLSKIEDAYFDGILDKDRYLKRKTEVTNEITNLTTQLNNSTPAQKPETTFELMEKFKDQAVSIGEMFENGSDEVKRELMLSALSNCEIRDGKIISTRYKKPYSYFVGLSKTDDLSKWRRRWDFLLHIRCCASWAYSAKSQSDYSGGSYFSPHFINTKKTPLRGSFCICGEHGTTFELFS